MYRIRLSSLLLLVVICAAPALAQDYVFHVDPAQSTVEFTLGDVMHTVHGTFQMKSSAIHFDPQTGKASGAFVVDATTGYSGSKGRDKKMHKEVLESAKYPAISFAVQNIHGAVPPEGTSQVEMIGIFTIHGADHPITVTAPVRVENGQAFADVHFQVPYVKWGMKNPSTFILRVSDKVDILVHAVGMLSVDGVAAAGAH